MVEKNDNKYIIFLDKTRHNGILRFTREITICVELDGYKPIFDWADVICSGGWFNYNWDEQEVFENDYPGVWEEALLELREYVEKLLIPSVP